jgi:hypothetical protein
VLFDADGRRLLGAENANGLRVGWKSVNNEFRYVQRLINDSEIFHYILKQMVVLSLIFCSVIMIGCWTLNTNAQWTCVIEK